MSKINTFDTNAPEAESAVTTQSFLPFGLSFTQVMRSADDDHLKQALKRRSYTVTTDAYSSSVSATAVQPLSDKSAVIISRSNSVSVMFL